MNIEQYERDGQIAYGAFARIVAAILNAAIGRESGYRLQQVTERAKQPASLKKKLALQQIVDTQTLEDAIKDLAGCRIVFYTNSDVTRFINSGIVDQNFVVLERKIHHPRRVVDDASDLYISNHYVVQLSPERASLPEYSQFAELRCEIQVQTILNHAWAEMAHDTIYKPPVLENFGTQQFEAIKHRMQKVARKYLAPAGYEFQRIASDFQRLIEGKALFDGDALEAIVNAVDNNARAESLETFAENVLPFYDDLQTVYPDIVTKLLEAASSTYGIEPVPIETPYGMLPGRTSGMVLKSIVDILTRYRYIDIDATFEAARTLYNLTEDERSRKTVLELCKSLTRHNLDVWRTYGPIAQSMVVQNIELLDDDARRALTTPIIAMLNEVLATEVAGTTGNSTSVTLHRGVVAPSDDLRALRKRAIALLEHQYSICKSEFDRRSALLALQTATRLPSSAYTNERLALIVLDDTRDVILFQTVIVPDLGLHLRQATETFVHHCYWNYVELPEPARSNRELSTARERVEKAALAFREIVNADADFVIYKVLVGYDSIFPPAWNDRDFPYEKVEAYRAEETRSLVSTVGDASADLWFDRICRYAETESDDLATFPTFMAFLQGLAEQQPAIALRYLDRLDNAIVNFLPSILAGLMNGSGEVQTREWIDRSLSAGKFVGQIAWYLRIAEPFDESILHRVLQSAIHHNDNRAVRNCLFASVLQFKKAPGTLIGGVFLPALTYLKGRHDLSWVHMPWFSWFKSPLLCELGEHEAGLVLDALVPHHGLEGSAEHIAGAVAVRWPERVMKFLAERQWLKHLGSTASNYDSLPFEVYELKGPLAAVPDVVLAATRQWFDDWPEYFRYDGARLIASIFPGLSSGFESRLIALVDGGKEKDVAFVLAVLSAFEGASAIYPILRRVVAGLPPESPLLSDVRRALYESGVVTGSYGHADLMAERKTLIETWLDDASELVASFANDMVRMFEQSVAAETRAAEAMIAARRLAFGEEPGDQNTNG
ncbi:ppGpp synthetase/RelA/SpoT-type nucleotidyltransferase [Paraburkholderia fungorum]|jgi:ppGpp synthetase/RelA/SpoT-type nucleotidyltranferase|uniref:RelA/SpoT domain-containing protein n=1 Tax=Paraburkholderia fungorum TaxID=134537 RepID=UPI000D058CF5|nr:RelA/SpoT domain-containing protein [Paraburkholderia fungorum]PRZ56038.1 ppGpp synthetase/RelA/SpoT-type nucleotidyltransferase [Paraburkholderia fungorum]